MAGLEMGVGRGQRMLHRLAWLTLICALLAAFTGALHSTSAAASPAAPPPSPSPPAATSPPASPHVPTPSPPLQTPVTPAAPTAPPEGTEPISPQDQAKPGSGLLGELDSQKVNGVPLRYYEITGGHAGMLDWDKKLLMFMTNGIFSFVKLIIGLMTWLLGWAFKFGPAEALLGPAREVSTTYRVAVVDRLNLPGFLLTLAGLWCGLLILRGRNSRGWGELGISVVISALAATTLVAPADLLMGPDGVMGKTRDTALALSSITATKGASDTQDPSKAAAPLQQTLLNAFIAKPHQMLQFGAVIDGNPEVPEVCKKIYVENFGAKKPTSLPTNPVEAQEAAAQVNDPMGHAMSKAKACKDLAEYHKEASWDRFFGALLLLFAALLVAVLVLLMVAALLMAICGLAFYAMTGHVVAVIAILPGGARGLLWRWCGGIAKIILVIVAIAVFIPLLTLFLDAMMLAAKAQGLMVQFALMDIGVGAGLVYHRRLLRFSTRAGHRIARRMEMARIGGSRGTGSMGGGYGGYGGMYGEYGMAGQGWLGSGDPYAISPVSASGTYRGARAEIDRVTAPVTATAAKAHRVWVGNPAKNAQAVAKQQQAGAGWFKAKMHGSRGGRTVWRTAKATRGTAKYTVGAPVSWSRAAAPGSPERQRAGQLRDRLIEVAHKPGQAAYSSGKYAQEYAANSWKVASWAPRKVAEHGKLGELFGDPIRNAADSTRMAATIRSGGAAAARHRTPAGGPPPRPQPATAAAPPPNPQAAAFRQQLDNQRFNRARGRTGSPRPPSPGQR